MKKKLKRQIETSLNTHTGAKIIKKRKLCNNKREHRKREMQYEDTTPHNKKTMPSATENSESLHMLDTWSNKI